MLLNKELSFGLWSN